MQNQSSVNYIGRFAPSPTGELHMGSLVAALASFLRARQEGGKWLLRIEDLDHTRCRKEHTLYILKTLEAHGLHWDDEVIYQSQRQDIYKHYLNELSKLDKVYNCKCTRKKLLCFDINPITGEHIYPGICRNLAIPSSLKRSVRLNTNNCGTIQFTDGFFGKLQEETEKETGDFIVWRFEDIASYQLAVVVDDELQKITEIVRGEDLLHQTPRQILLQKILNFRVQKYFHIPLILDKNGKKLSKQNKSPYLDNKKAKENISFAMSWLCSKLVFKEDDILVKKLFLKI